VRLKIFLKEYIMNKTDLEESLEYLQNKLKEYKGVWVKSARTHDTGIGYTFEEKILEKVEDNLSYPDLAELEIKSQRMNSSSKMTLFTKSPVYPLRANTYIRDNFGVDDEVYPSKIIHTSFFGNRISHYKDGYGFKLESNDNDQKLYLRVFDRENNVIDTEIYWTYPVLNDILNQKIHNVGFVEAKTKKEDGNEYFMYKKLTILMNPSIENFIKNINDGTIQFDIRIGIYRSGKNKGKPHDHGSGFRISKKDFSKLFETVELIEF